MALFTIEQLERAESYLADEKYDTILPAFEGMVADMEVYIDEMCPTSDEVQWFSFASPFERLTYQRVESDPRELRDVPVPFDRAYADLAFCQINLERFEEAAANLKQAVRWNPMNCSHRLNLAGVLRHTGDYEEFLRLSYSVFARASHSWHLVRAYDNFADYFMNCEQYDTAAACVKCGLRLNKDDKRLLERAEELREERQCDPATQTDELTEALLDPQGIPEGANVEVVLERAAARGHRRRPQGHADLRRHGPDRRRPGGAAPRHRARPHGERGRTGGLPRGGRRRAARGLRHRRPQRDGHARRRRRAGARRGGGAGRPGGGRRRDRRARRARQGG